MAVLIRLGGVRFLRSLLPLLPLLPPGVAYAVCWGANCGRLGWTEAGASLRCAVVGELCLYLC